MCAVPIEKDEGCAQMMCKRCKHVFCWYCLASLDVSRVHSPLLMYSLIQLPFFLHRMTFCCGTTTRGPARTNWVIRVPRSSGIAPKLLAYLLALVFCCWWHRRFCCWRRLALFAASVAAAVAPRWTRSTPSWRRRWPHCRANPDDEDDVELVTFFFKHLRLLSTITTTKKKQLQKQLNVYLLTMMRAYEWMIPRKRERGRSFQFYNFNIVCIV